MRKDHENTKPNNNKATKECCVVRMFIPTLFICNLYREVNHCCDFSLLSVVEPNAFNSGMFYSKQLPYLCVQCLPAALRDQCPLRSHQAMTSRGWLMKQKAPFAQPCQASRPAHCVVLEVFQHSWLLCHFTLGWLRPCFYGALIASFLLAWSTWFLTVPIVRFLWCQSFLLFLGKAECPALGMFCLGLMMFCNSLIIPCIVWLTMFHAASLEFWSLFELVHRISVILVTEIWCNPITVLCDEQTEMLLLLLLQK